MNTKKLITTLGISALLLTGCGFHDKDTIIVVNNDKITKSEFEEAFNTIAQDKITDPKDPLYMMLKDNIVNELVVKKLLEQEIEKRQITVSEEEEEAALKNLIDRYGSKETFQTELRRNGISNDKFKKDLINELKMRKLIELLGTVNVTDLEVKNFYKQHPDKFKTPDRVRASHILISANPKEIEAYLLSDKENQSLSKEELEQKVQAEMAAQKAKAEQILAEVKKNPKNFEKIAREKSEDVASGQQGGDLGFFAYKDMVEPFSKAAFSLKPNKVSDIVQSDYGYHIIMVKDRAKAGTISFEKAKDNIKLYLMTEKQVKLLENLIVSLKNNAKIEFVDEDFKPKHEVTKPLTEEKE